MRHDPVGSTGATTGWLAPSESRVGLGCMRLWTGSGDDSAAATVAAAVEAGITVYDTARIYEGPGGEAGGNEHHLAQLLRMQAAGRSIRVVTKGGMRRQGTAWIPDGRARSIADDCETSLAALGGIPIDLYLLHTPDPARPWRTSLRALARLLDEGLVRRVGLSNVTRVQLEEAAGTIPVTAVEVALNPFDDSRLRDGTVTLCGEQGITVIAHSPLGGPRRVASLQRNAQLRDLAERHGVSAQEMTLAWELGLGPNVVVIPGARRPRSVQSAVRSALLQLAGAEREELRRTLGRPAAVRVETSRPRTAGDVILVMGIPGAGKSRIAEDCVRRGYARLNRDLRGGSLRDLCTALDDHLERGTRAVVLDNTWLTRAIRSRAVEVAARHGVAIRCVWLDIALADAQRNAVERLLARRDTLPAPEEVRGFDGRDGMISPTAQMRALRELEPPSADEGFVHVERRPFVRSSAQPPGSPGVFVAASAVWQPDATQTLAAEGSAHPHLVFDWRPDGNEVPLEMAVTGVREVVSGPVSGSLCPHPAGPPACWCRPHLLGLVLQFARRRGIDPSRSVLIGTSPTHRSMAGTLGCRYVAV
ncbi:MAG TPA: aldo/keto reductase [Candidatus Dormibacteraeota bacterium]